jgi:prevent-host-death family protein
MIPVKISTLDLRAHTGNVLNRVFQMKERFIVERKGQPMAALVSVDDFKRLERLENEQREPSVLLWQSQTLKSPILLTVERAETGDVLVSDSALHLYGIGATLQEAVADYESMLLEDYETLSENSGRLSPKLQEHLSCLKLIVA